MKKVLSFALLLVVSLGINACGSKSVAPANAPEFVNAYYKATYTDVKNVESRLKKAGFEVLGHTKVAKKKMTSVIFTNPALKAMANKPTRGLLAGSLRVLVNPKQKELLISNPLYFIKAFMQDDYKIGSEVEMQKALLAAFPSAVATEDKLKYDVLSGYHFMVGMPYYKDQLVVGEANTVEALVKKAEHAKKKAHVFTLKLSENRYVVGLHLGKRTEKFSSKIGADKSGLLPWSVLIEEVDVDGKKVARATALPAEYYIAVSYPLLDLGGFATIMTAPGAVKKDLIKVFK